MSRSPTSPVQNVSAVPLCSAGHGVRVVQRGRRRRCTACDERDRAIAILAGDAATATLAHRSYLALRGEILPGPARARWAFGVDGRRVRRPSTPTERRHAVRGSVGVSSQGARLADLLLRADPATSTLSEDSRARLALTRAEGREGYGGPRPALARVLSPESYARARLLGRLLGRLGSRAALADRRREIQRMRADLAEREPAQIVGGVSTRIAAVYQRAAEKRERSREAASLRVAPAPAPAVDWRVQAAIDAIRARIADLDHLVATGRSGSANRGQMSDARKVRALLQAQLAALCGSMENQR